MKLFVRPRVSRLLLYLSAAGASYGLFRGGTMESVHGLPLGEEGWEAFNDLLMANPGLPVRVAVDTVDEIYRQDVLPRARGRDRQEMTARRLRQLIHHTPYQAAQRQGPLAEGGGRDRYLMMGLSSPEIIRPWLDIIHIRNSHVDGIWLLPALAIPLVRLFGYGKQRLLLVSEQTGGLRLSYLEQGELRFSRLAPVDSSQYENPLEGYAEEIERTRQALVGQRLLARADILRTVLLDPINSLADLPRFLSIASGFECELIQRAQLLDRMDLPPSLLTESPDALHLRLLPLAPDSANLITREQRDIARAQRLKRYLRLSAGLWLSASILACAFLLLDAWRLEGQAEELRQGTKMLRDQEAATLAASGGGEVLHQRLDALDAWQAVSDVDRKPGPAFSTALAALASVENLRPRRFIWTANASQDIPGLIMEGEVFPFQGNYRSAHDQVDALAGKLKRHLAADETLEVTDWPLDTSSQHELEGEFGHSQLSAHFRLETRPGP